MPQTSRHFDALRENPQKYHQDLPSGSPAAHVDAQGHDVELDGAEHSGGAVRSPTGDSDVSSKGDCPLNGVVLSYIEVRSGREQ